MGVTIHFEGQLKSNADYDKVMMIAKTFAETNAMTFSFFEATNKLLQRVKDEEDWDYVGTTKGIVIQPHETCDPLILEFDDNNYLQEYCKTQFTDIITHSQIVSLFRQIEDCFVDLQVADEGEYWETEDAELLAENFNNSFLDMELAIKENPELKGPYRVEDGRIIDLM
jgi:hypothetical protein